MTEQTEQLLGRIGIFRRLSAEDRAALAAVSEVELYEKGSEIFAEGDPSDHFFFVVTGRVKVYKLTPSGKQVILEIMGVGDPFGAVATFEGSPFPATAVALSDTVCLRLPRGRFFALLEEYPTLVRGLLVGLTHRLIELTKRIAELSGGKVEPRLARFFIKLAREQGIAEGDHIKIPMPLSRQELADLTGTTIETCIRIMSRWGKEGLVRTDDDGFTVLDHDVLEVLAVS
jgi:CRP/FNR family transcriptional regulator